MRQRHYADPDTAVGVHKYSGTFYGFVAQSRRRPGYYRCSARIPVFGGQNVCNYIKKEDVHILRPEAVQTVLSRQFHPTRPSLSRDELVLTVLAHVPKKAFIDFDGFIDKLDKLYKQIGGTE
jgi:hypothetical protein